MKSDFRYADLHCHPNLKTFGHSFDIKKGPKSDLWHPIPPSVYSRGVHQLTGITKFSQTDFSTMSRSKARIAFMSLYPFEKGFFINPHVWPPLAAFLADWGIEIGYERIRYIQKHTDYFTDLLDEYNFVLNSPRERVLDGKPARWALTRNWSEVEQLSAADDTIAVVLTIEGAHVFNTGLDEFGVPHEEEEVLANIRTVKQWDYPPLFIGLAHNFNNGLCGHARSLQRLGKLVNQERGLDTGISSLGHRVIHALLNDSDGRRIYIDLKHMSLAARFEYYHMLNTDYSSEKIPLVVSHGSVTGRSVKGMRQSSCFDIFNTGDLNFFDEEIIEVVMSGGLLAIQMDMTVHAERQKVKGFLKEFRAETPIRQSARIIWNQLQHIAEVCDRAGLYAWGSTSVGSDFDGSIHPFPGVLTAAGLEPLAKELVQLAHHFLSNSILSVPENRNITGEEIVERFMYTNIEGFLREFFGSTTANTRPISAIV